ncbi:ABC-type transport auxiliary lipoprotein family protein [Oleisolibacter albus]|uniref:ABC-type transport auxiliary lipoprotein family protein n=1 Tax=Oleisolibacter albus TaxID=2171757 RepID=UPI000DF38D92|nr:ABC-type transport auxiliary lipoprotein family protein [Oleisolibacter albus]
MSAQPFRRPLPRRALLSAAALLPLGACSAARLLDPGAPPRLYTLSPAREFAAGLPRVDWQLVVETPLANTGIDTGRIALGETPARLTYYADCAWVDTAPEMVQLLLVESLENSNRIVAVGVEASGLRSDFVLKSDLRDFQAEYNGGSPDSSAPEAHVRLNAKLVRMPRRNIVASDTFEARVAAKSASFDHVIAAFDQALDMVLRRTVEWTLRQGAANAAQAPLPTASR